MTLNSIHTTLRTTSSSTSHRTATTATATANTSTTRLLPFLIVLLLVALYDPTNTHTHTNNCYFIVESLNLNHNNNMRNNHSFRMNANKGKNKKLMTLAAVAGNGNGNDGDDSVHVAATAKNEVWRKKRQSPKQDKKSGSTVAVAAAVSGANGGNGVDKSKRRRKKKPSDEYGNGNKVAAEIEIVAATETTTTSNGNSNGNGSSSSHLSSVEFASLQSISAESRRAIQDLLKYRYLTKVQDATLSAAMDGKDLVAKAKTGTGKTIGFLLPIVERIVKEGGSSRDNIDGLILSPTRELAMQIAVEAEALTKFHPSIKVAVLIGGTSMAQDKKKLGAGPGIIVATPGRLIDHLESNTQGLPKQLRKLKTLVLDEADRLLDMGFKPSLEKIIKFLPSSSRQTLLYSATFPASVEQISKIALKPSYTFIDTIEEGDQQTNIHVEQESIVCSLDGLIPTLESILHEHMTTVPGYKVIVFFNTARTAGFFAQLFKEAGYNALEMHSRKNQTYRVRVSNEFRTKQNQVMFSSDVSARGVDYPDVSLVVQVGLTEYEQYIHRLGRTGRAGRKGRGVLLLCDFETKFLDTLSDLDIKIGTAGAECNVQSLRTTSVVQSLPPSLHLSAAQAYQAFLGYYNSNTKRLGKMSKEKVVILANDFSRVIGLETPPALLRKTVGKMGLTGTPGLRFEEKKQQQKQKRYTR